MTLARAHNQDTVPLSLQIRNAVSLESFKNNYLKNLSNKQQELHHFIV